MMLVEDFKKGINNSLKEIQENTAKQGEVFKEIRENTTKQVMELNKTTQDLKREVE
jgi:DNA topoisomerase IA